MSKYVKPAVQVQCGLLTGRCTANAREIHSNLVNTNTLQACDDRQQTDLKRHTEGEREGERGRDGVRGIEE